MNAAESRALVRSWHRCPYCTSGIRHPAKHIVRLADKSSHYPTP
jgi:hypothetical protein